MIILDLREQKEVETRKIIVPSVNIPAYSNFMEALEFVLSEDAEFLLVCSSGNRAKMIHEKLPAEKQSSCKVFIGNVMQLNRLLEEEQEKQQH